MRNKTIQTTQQKQSRRVQANERVISAMSTKKLRDLLLNNCVGEGGQEYCQDTIERVLARRGTVAPKEQNNQPTWEECFADCKTEHDKACRNVMPLVQNCVFALQLKKCFFDLGFFAAIDMAKNNGSELYEMFLEEQFEKSLTEFC
jgi:hypothetical protein